MLQKEQATAATGEQLFKATNHYMCVSGFSCAPVASIFVISVVFSGYKSVPLFVHSGLIL